MTLNLPLEGNHSRYFNNPIFNPTDSGEEHEKINAAISKEWLIHEVANLANHLISHMITEDEVHEGEELTL